MSFLLFVKILLLVILIAILLGCSSVSKMPEINRIEQPDYAINHVEEGARTQEIIKAMVISWKQCTSYAERQRNVIEAAQN